MDYDKQRTWLKELSIAAGILSIWFIGNILLSLLVQSLNLSRSNRILAAALSGAAWTYCILRIRDRFRQPR